MEQAMLNSVGMDITQILAIATGIVLLSSLLEKVFGIDIIGRKIMRLVWRIIKFCFNWFVMPAKPKIEKIKKVVVNIASVDERLNTIIENDKKRDEIRQSQFNEIKTLALDVKKEVTINGGSSMKDAVEKLLSHDYQKWESLQEIGRNVRLINLRLDIVDKSDHRMIFKLSPSLDIIDIAPSFLRFFGYIQEDLIGKRLEDFSSQENAKAIQHKWESKLKSKSEYKGNQIILDSSGVSHDCCVKGYPIIEEGVLSGYFGTIEVLDQECIKPC